MSPNSHRLLTSIYLGMMVFAAGCVQPEDISSAAGINAPPVIQNLTATPSPSRVGEIVTVQADAQDPDGDELHYEWYMTAGDLSGNGPVVRYIATYCCVGINTVRVTVSDGRGSAAQRSIDVEVRP